MNTNGKTKKTSISQGVLFLQRHPVLVSLILVGCLFVVPSISFAAPDNNVFVQGAIYLLYYVYVFCSYLVTLAATLFLWAIDTNVFSGLLNNGAVYEVWVVVRDFLNIFFILVLLFAAFATIFQLDRYEYKKTLPMLVLMALLVNFSFPVSRVVIDLANVPMYFFTQNVFATTDINIVQSVLGGSQIQKIILPNITSASDAASNASLPQMLAGVICMFLFGASFLVLAVLMLVRIIALTILVMFSPIGFVGMITPALQSFAKGWWDKLFKWAFYGPIAVMFVLVAIIVMKVGGDVQSAHAMSNLTGDQGLSTFISNMAFFTIPIVLFWIAITSTEKYSNDISGLGVKWGSNLGRKAGNLVRRGTWGATGGAAIGLTRYGWKQSGIPGGVKAWWNERTGWFSSKASERWREEAEARRRALLPGGDKDAALKALERKRVNERVEENKKANKPYEILQEEMNKGVKSGASAADREKAAAAALTMADKEMFESSEDFKSALESVSGDMDSVTKVIRKAPKEMLRSSDDLTKALEAVSKATGNLRPAAQAQIKNQLIDKVGSGALAKTGADYERMITALGDSDLEKVLQSKMGKEGRLKAVLEYKVKGSSSDAEKFTAYNDILKDFDASDLGKQAGLMDVDDFQKFFKEKGTRGEYNADFFTQYMKVAKGGNREKFRKAVIATP